MSLSSLYQAQAQCRGDITLSSQAEVNAFACSTVGTGVFTISGADIEDLSPLSVIERINAQVVIKNNPQLSNLKGLENLREIGGALIIENNPILSSLEGLQHLKNVIFQLIIDGNPQLENLEGLNQLNKVQLLYIENCANLKSTQGLDRLLDVSGMWISNNPNLENIESLVTLQRLRNLFLTNNDQLKSIQPLSNLQDPLFQLTIQDNERLENLKGLESVSTLTQLQIMQNAGLKSLEGLEGHKKINFIQIIDNASLEHLAGLENLEESGDLSIRGNPRLEDLQGLENLKRLSGEGISVTNNQNLRSLKGLDQLQEAIFLTISHNPQLESLDGLSRLKNVRFLSITLNDKLRDLKGLDSLENVGLDLGIEGNPLLQSLEHLQMLRDIGGALQIINNPKLTSLQGLNNVRSLGTAIIENSIVTIRGNTSLVDISALDDLAFPPFDFNVFENPQLNDCCLLDNLIQRGVNVNLRDNGPTCDSKKTLFDLCRDTFIDRLVLVNAESNQDIMPLEDKSVIPLSQLGQTPLSIRAETDTSFVRSVTFRLKGPKHHFQRENVQPFSLFGDNGPEDYQGEILSSGNYELFVQAFSEKKAQGISGKQLRIRFSLGTENPQIERLVLTEPKQARISTYPPITLRDGISIDIDEISFGTGFFNFTVLADTDPSQIGSVHYQLEGPVNQTQTENQAPYTLFGDFIDIWLLGGEIEQEVLNYKARRLLSGNYTLRVTPYPLPNRQGIAGETKIIRFRAFDSARDTDVSIQVSPNPTSEEIHIDSPEGGVLHIYNGQGEMIFQKEYSRPFSQDIDLQNQPKGIYLIQLQNKNGVQELKLIRE